MESTDIQLARMDERMKMILDKMEENHESLVRSRAWMQQVDRQLDTISSRVTGVEASLAKASPTIEDYLVFKNKVIGAGAMGRWLWVLVGFLLSLIITARHDIINLVRGG